MQRLLRVVWHPFTTKNPYSVLGINSTASVDEIKKAFRSIAQKNHPDRNPDIKAQQFFVEANQAYELLMDEDKRRQFDNENLGTGRAYGFNKNPFDEFSDTMYKDKSRAYHETYSTGGSRKRKGDNVFIELPLTFMSSIKGATMEASFEKRSTCQTCNGNRCRPGTAPTRCLSCGGSGSTVYRNGSVVMHLDCNRCHGIGLVIKNPCPDCKATGIKVQSVTETIDIPAGIDNSSVLTIKEKRHQSENGPNGDLIVKVKVEEHSRLVKKKENIYSIEWITVSQAALGTLKSVETVWGNVGLSIPAGTQDGTELRIRNHGVDTTLVRGDHVVEVRVKIPTSLTEKQRAIFNELAKLEDPLTKEDSSDVFTKFKNLFN